MRTIPVAILGLTLLFTAISSGTAENVKFGIPGLTVTMMPLPVAKERGFFQQEGLNVELVLMPAAQAPSSTGSCRTSAWIARTGSPRQAATR